MRAIDTILDRVDFKKTGSGFIAKCPAHNDKQASLSISEGEDGRVLLHCFAGCSVEQIVHALGLTLSDLFSSNGTTARGSSTRRRCSLQQYAAAKQLSVE